MTEIGFVGLGKMGGNMVHRIRRDSEHEVVAFDFDKKAVAQAQKNGARGASSLADLVKKLKAPRIVWIMVPAGDPTQQTVDKLAKLLEKGDTIVDGGNSKWTDDKRRAKVLTKLGIRYVDVGVSGGVWGIDVGYCMMVGGPPAAVKGLAPILDVLAPPTSADSVAAIGKRGWMHFGSSGAGHYVKMVHNGVEYGLMQAYAEGFDVFDKSEYELDNAKIAHLWNQGSVVRSWLCELAARAFEADGNELQAIEGFTEDSGEGRWTIEDATAKDVPTPVITASLYERFSSRGNGDFAHRVLAALRNQFGGHAVKQAPEAVTAVAVESENPLTAGLERLPVFPTTLVIFGATGDLARRKLLPALYNLAHDGALPERFHLVGVSRREKENADYREECEQAIRQFSRRTPDPEVLKRLLEHVKYVPGTFDDERVYSKLEKVLDRFEERDGEPLNRAFYLSTAPSFFPVIVEALGKQGLDRHEQTDVRVIIEKPFGTSLEEARELNRRVLGVFEEQQVFRIDHYLGKETVQNMMAFRFANGMFEPLWNRNYIDQVQITAAEDIGIGTRAGYYDHAGALRDLIQNHMLQLLCHVAMEPPVSFTADEVRNEKVKVLQSIAEPVEAEIEQMAVRAQYGKGHAGGEDAEGYLEEPGIPQNSITETYAALRLEVDNWRWAGVPFYLRTGKRLARKVTEIAVTLKPVPHLAFSQDGSLGVLPNQLILTLQPNEGVSLRLGAKIPGSRMVIRPVHMEFLYGTAFLSQSPEAYERLITDAMRGDATLFTRDDEVEAQWRICDPVLKYWEPAHPHTPGPLPQYESGSQGPSEADEILLPEHSWRAI